MENRRPREWAHENWKVLEMDLNVSDLGQNVKISVQLYRIWHGIHVFSSLFIHSILVIDKYGTNEQVYIYI